MWTKDYGLLDHISVITNCSESQSDIGMLGALDIRWVTLGSYQSIKILLKLLNYLNHCQLKLLKESFKLKKVGLFCRKTIISSQIWLCSKPRGCLEHGSKFTFPTHTFLRDLMGSSTKHIDSNKIIQKKVCLLQKWAVYYLLKM